MYLLYGILILQFVGVLLSFFVRNWFERVQRDIDEIERRCEERGDKCPIDRVEERIDHLQESIRENRADIERLREKIIK